MTVALSAAGCEDDVDPLQDRLQPGPCTATKHPEGGPADLDCTMGYDEADHLTSIECSSPDERTRSELTQVFSGDELTEVTHVYRFRQEPGLGLEDIEEEQTWTLGETVTRTAYFGADRGQQTVETHEPDGFRFIGHPFDPEWSPHAPDSLVHSTVTRTDTEADPQEVITFEIDYTYDGPPREGTRTRTGSDGTTSVFRYDTSARLVEWTSTRDDTPDARSVVTYDYDGDLLVRIDIQSIVEGGNDGVGTEFEHDSSGNLIEMRRFPVNPPIQITEFGYDCW